MKNQVSAAVLIIIVLLGVSANSAAYGQQIITPQVQPQVQPRVQNAVVDLNSPNLVSANSSLLVNNNCLNGVVVYQTSLITNQPVPVCVTSEMMNSQLLNAWGQLFNVDVTLKSDNNDNNNNNDNNENKKHHHKHY